MLTPLAHGCAMLATGPARPAVTDLVLRLACNLAAPDVHVIYAASCDGAALRGRVDALRAAGALPHTTVIAADPGAPRAQQYAALCAAMSVGEAVRDDGGHAVVLGDSAECMVALWETAARMARGGAAADASDGAPHATRVHRGAPPCISGEGLCLDWGRLFGDAGVCTIHAPPYMHAGREEQ